MKNLFLVLLMIGGSFTTAFGQFHYTIISNPDSATVLINGKIVGNTPYVASYYWKKTADDKRIIFSIEQDGYETWSDTLMKKPLKFDKRVAVTLERKLPAFKFDSTSTVFVAFDKVIARFDNSQQIGNLIDKDGKTEPIKWEGTVKSGEQAFENKFYEVLAKTGIPTVSTKDITLFNQREKNKLPRFIVGARIKDYWINVVNHKKDKAKAGKISNRVRMTIEWQVLDKSTGKVALTATTTGISHTRSSSNSAADNLAAFEDALIRFLETNRLTDLMKSSLDGGISSFSEKDTTQTTVALKLNPVKLPAFKNFSELVKIVSPSCVTIITDGGHGSGAIIDERGYILTAYHVVDGVNRIRVKFGNGMELQAKLIRFDYKTDVALLKIEGNHFTALPIGTVEAALGEDVFTIGTPAEIELGQSISKGTLSGKRLLEQQTYLQIDMAVSPGNSGGPLFDEKGFIIGIIDKKIVGSGVEGIGFAIPISTAIKTLHLEL